MVLNFFNVVYVLVALAMIILILLQRGAGAQAGSGFGSGASATVFGARGSANFLSRSTAVLAGLFFLLSLGMGMYLGHSGTARPVDDLGVMGNAPDAKTAPAPVPATSGDVPSAPSAPAATSDKPSAAPASDVPVAPAADKPAAPPPAAAQSSQAPAAAAKNAPKADTAKKDGGKKK